jgi:hypothetical protein
VDAAPASGGSAGRVPLSGTSAESPHPADDPPLGRRDRLDRKP